MDLILNFGFAWISVLIVIILTIIYFLRKLMNKSQKNRALFKNANKFLRKHHKTFGIALIITGLIHALYSSDSLFSLNIGTVSWVLSILLGLNYMFRKRILHKKGWLFYHRILTVGFIGILVLHILDVGIQAPYLLAASLKQSQFNASTDEGTSSTNDTSSISDISSTADTSLSSDASISNLNEQMEGIILEDGVYEGEATGYREGLIVSVEVKDSLIISIEIVDHNEQKSRYYTPAIEEIPQAIIDSQSIEVDAVSGSTFTSIGIINAVRDALSQAIINGILPTELSLPARRGHR
ncbi:MAG: FMN-binding protein [Mobilitalea sp.]